ncbi:glycosyl transferase [Gluconobacter thailandicus F149-1 = NBRC 100600]|uniref:Glycosyltransferase 2-like domain-containing protein n=1 Tax=Gluconobacter thailandicus NBRC 3257 TaxID=1381097 RepID=A0ABQ0IZS6_GLUTH|nr:glycosyltransferase family 2 protein [Gluconobacter thailandicus]GAC88181.1 hypothetical protein NBRC3255_1842 [Gluconobacter thailandicus NBRC 3255]GAD27709.1 hypothetical protein NBRC3257_2708 [Gluconobacter thailandicus NBRC 3257]GAN93178.1 glycosyl transferase [Gluconobacter thailandicus F149-1 = NBRC 100600]GEL86923.1 hypothetical protein GTH01_12810 [Gluconobacter thailandicus F149-1 = NBRC 100600]
MSEHNHFITSGRQVIIAIPVCNEEEHIIPCLLALARQNTLPDKVVLWINNTTDQTYDQAHSLINVLPFELEMVRIVYPETLASAGSARRDAMAFAAQGASPDALLFTTDADSEAAEDWVNRTLDVFARYPVEAVFGRALLLPSEARKIPFHLHEDERAEQAYGALLEQITLLIHPEPHDPWPRHLEHSGASIAVTHQAWRKVGGIPCVPTGEDRQFYQALRRHGVPVRHAPEVIVYVSARLTGRAKGGMAETLARRVLAQDEYIDEIFEPVSRRLLRIRRGSLYNHLNLANTLEYSASDLNSVRIPRNELSKHFARAQRVLDYLRHTKRSFPDDFLQKPACQFDTPHFVRPYQAASNVLDMPG